MIEEAPVPTARQFIKKATLLQLTFMIYGAVCGGAFGLEDMIGSAGPGISLVVLIAMPFVFSIPLSFAVAELTTAFPVEGGIYRWSRMAFGDFWGFQTGWWAWMSGVVTNSTFAVLFADYLFKGVSAADSVWMKAHPAGTSAIHWLICAAMIWALFFLNLRGIDVVGDSSVILSVLLLLPFVVMCVLGLMHWHFNPFVPFTKPGQTALGYGTALAVSVWLYSGYEKLSSAAEEVEQPQKVFPPALFMAATLAMASYVLPTLLALASMGNWSAWAGAYFPVAAAKMGGYWLGMAMVAGGLLSNLLLLNVTMMSVSRVPMTLAEDGLLHHAFARVHEKWGTPTVSLAFQAVLIMLLSLFNFTQLAVIYSWFQMLSNLMVYANVWAMRRTHADAPRPFKVPFGMFGLLLVTAPTCLIALAAMATAVFDNGVFSWTMLVTAAIALASGPVLYVLGGGRRGG